MSRRLFAVFVLGLACLVAGCDQNGQKSSSDGAAQADARHVPLGPLPRVVVPNHYRVQLTVDPRKDGFSGHAEIAVTFNKARKSIFIHGNQLKVTTAQAKLPDGSIVGATYKQVDPSGVAILTFGEAVPAGKAVLSFDYTAPFNQSLAGLYKVVEGGEAYAFTQFENIDARRAFPGFDEPGFKTPFDITVIAPDGDKVVANTPVVSDTGAGQGMMKWVFATTKPLPTYLVALAVGPLDIVDMGDIPADKYRTRPIHLRGVTAKGQGARIKYALQFTPAIVQALENYYGLSYPYQKLDILAVPDFAAGAMENAGAVTFREQLLLMDANAPLQQRRASVTVQAHELAHQWFGDLVTPKWWDNIWLNESFATWMEYKIAQIVKPEWNYDLDTLNSSESVMRLDELPSARQIHQPVHGPDDIDNAFDDITYSKGAATLAMFENFVGPAVWQKGIHAYLEKYAFGTATADDFIGTIAQTTNHPEIVKSFHDFIDQSGIPVISANISCAGEHPLAEITQMPYTPIGIAMAQHTWRIPACLNADNVRACGMVTPKAADVALGEKCPKTVFPNADGAGYYRFSEDPDGWDKLIAAVPKMNDAERFALFHNADAALRGGSGTAKAWFGTITALAPNIGWQLLDSDRRGTFNLTDSLREMRVTGIIKPDDLPKLQAFVRRAFGPRMKSIGLTPLKGESAAVTMLRPYLAQLLVEEGNDTALIAQLARAANTYVSTGGKSYGGITPELLQEAMRAAVMKDGAPFAGKLMDMLKTSNDEYFEQCAIYAIAGSDDPQTIKQLLDLSLTPTIRIGDVRYVYRDLRSEAAARPILWDWFQSNVDKVVARQSTDGMSDMPSILKYGCDVNAKTELDAFFGPRAKVWNGTPRTLKENDDRIDRCIAFRQAKGPTIAAALEAMK